MRKILLLLKSPIHTLRLVGVVSEAISAKELESDKNENSFDSALTTCRFIYELGKTRSGSRSWRMNLSQGLIPCFVFDLVLPLLLVTSTTGFSQDHTWWSCNRMIRKHFSLNCNAPCIWWGLRISDSVAGENQPLANMCSKSVLLQTA